MKFLVLSVLVLMLVVLAQSKSVPAEEVAELIEKNPTVVLDFVEHVLARLDPEEAQQAQGFQVPFQTRSCDNQVCRDICNMLGFKNGQCISVDTCQCS